MGVVVLRNLDIDTLGNVAVVLKLEGIAIVFGVAEHKEVLGISTLGNPDAAFVGIRDNLELLVGDDILIARFGVARVRRLWKHR